MLAVPVSAPGLDSVPATVPPNCSASIHIAMALGEL